MVVFTCGACGDTVKKPKVAQHYQTKCTNCWVLTCMDCGKDFEGEAYQSHTRCAGWPDEAWVHMFCLMEVFKSHLSERVREGVGWLTNGWPEPADCHRSCISEAEKYQGDLFQGTKNAVSKGAAKQEKWLEVSVDMMYARPGDKGQIFIVQSLTVATAFLMWRRR